MKCIAALMVDLEHAPLGTRNRLAEPLAGKPVLRRTVERLLACSRISSVHLLTTPSQRGGVESLVSGLPVEIEPLRLPPSPYAELIRAGRWWGLDGWRGGVGGLSVFDEDANVGALAALAARQEADAVTVAPAAAAMIDPRLSDAMVAHFETVGRTFELTFAQTPPGLSPLIVGRKLLEELSHAAEPVGLILAYNPDRPVADLTGKECCYRPAGEVIEASGRLICDTRRSFERVRELIEAGGEAWDAARVGSWLQQRTRTQVVQVPSEIEIELTTDAGAAEGNLLRPCGSEVPKRGLCSFDVVRAIADAVRDWDDVRIVLAGFGEPCAHPAFGEICRMFRPAAAALAVRTFARFGADHVNGGDLQTSEDALFETPVDIVEVMVDAVSAETYARLHGVDAFAEVTARIERWLERRVAAGRARPLIVPSFVKCNENLDEMEPFFESWQRRLGMVLVTGHSHYARQRPHRAVTSMAPPQRSACKRVFSRMVVLADGHVTTCDQDYRGAQSLGRLPDATLIELWNARRFVQIRANELSDVPLCAKCDEWHRP